MQRKQVDTCRNFRVKDFLPFDRVVCFFLIPGRARRLVKGKRQGKGLEKFAQFVDFPQGKFMVPEKTGFQPFQHFPFP